MAQSKSFVQIVWGAALILAGVGVLYRIPQVMPRIEEQFSSSMGFFRFCSYLLAVLLIGGGAKKIYDNRRKLKS